MNINIVIFIALGIAVIFIIASWFVDWYLFKDDRGKLGNRFPEAKTKIPMPDIKGKRKIAYFANIQLDFYDNGKPAYSVNFPDLDSCVTFGDTLEEALENARDVLKQYLIHSEPQFIKPPSSSLELIRGGITGWLKEIEVEINKEDIYPYEGFDDDDDWGAKGM